MRYMGYITLARTARVMSAANGEQILISGEAYDKYKEAGNPDFIVKKDIDFPFNHLINFSMHYI